MPKRASKAAETLHPLLAPVASAMAKDKSVERFNANSLRTKGKVFAMVVKERLVLRLPSERGAELVASKKGAFLVMGSKTMKEWTALSPAASRDVGALA